MKLVYLIIIIAAVYIITGIVAYVRGPIIFSSKLTYIYPYHFSPLTWILNYEIKGDSDVALKLGSTERGKYKVNIFGSWEKISADSAETSNVKTFSHQGPPKFSFAYPQFTDWHTEIINNTEIRYRPDEKLHIQMEYPPFIAVKVIPKISREGAPIINPKGIKYKTSDNKLLFLLEGKDVEITVDENKTYSGFFMTNIENTIISSFTVN